MTEDQIEQPTIARRRDAARRINPKIPVTAQEVAVKPRARIACPELPANNEVFRRRLTEGARVEDLRQAVAASRMHGWVALHVCLGFIPPHGVRLVDCKNR